MVKERKRVYFMTADILSGYMTLSHGNTAVTRRRKVIKTRKQRGQLHLNESETNFMIWRFGLTFSQRSLNQIVYFHLYSTDFLTVWTKMMVMMFRK